MEMELSKKRILSLRQVGWAVTLVYALLGSLLIVIPDYQGSAPAGDSFGGSLRGWFYLVSSSVVVYFLVQIFIRKLFQGEYLVSLDSHRSTLMTL